MKVRVVCKMTEISTKESFGPASKVRSEREKEARSDPGRGVSLDEATGAGAILKDGSFARRKGRCSSESHLRPNVNTIR